MKSTIRLVAVALPGAVVGLLAAAAVLQLFNQALAALQVVAQ